MLRIGVLVSGGGTNLQAILDAIATGEIPDARVELVISNKQNAYALTRASESGVASAVISGKSFKNSAEFDRALSRALHAAKIDLVLLAGFMAILGPDFFTGLENKVMNVHPALIPAFSGPGYYGLKVHEAVLATGCKVTGASVHFVTPEVDAGPLILQKAVEVRQDDDAETLQKRVMEEAEWKIYPQAVRLFAQGRLTVHGHQVIIS
ncbi:MAG: phosphoribosylglycinamide formyltransferase [Candidatus Marinimicrobia bacterium]|nr:phosphoribosylglycinamide formyltransferase [Candidatus Neomarinimicrobiota bacterium]